jgi:hypothetical protein
VQPDFFFGLGGARPRAQLQSADSILIFLF